MNRAPLILATWTALIAASAGPVAAQQAPVDPAARPVSTPDGVVHVPAFDLPPSSFVSPVYLDHMKRRAGATHPVNLAAPDISVMRAGIERQLAPQVADTQRRYPVTITSQTIAGVKTRTVMPKNGEANPRHVLINLHGGGFSMCADACAMLESIPIAALGRFKVVTVDYRQGPENVFPAASEDVAAVYRELLKTYRPENVGIYGCSAGGALTGEVAAWFQKEHLPNPAALGIFGAGGVRFGSGDSAYVAAYIDGSFPPPEATPPIGYFRGARMDDPLISPALHKDVIARFPPTLLITGTRAMDMSPAIYTHTELVKAGVDSQLIVGEGMGHCYIYDATTPEARDAYDIIVRFFGDHLGKGTKRGSAR